MKLTSLIVGVDFTNCSAVAMKEAMRLAQFSRAKLTALHVIDTLVASELQEALSPFQKDITSGLMEDAKRAWTEFAAAIPGASGLPFDVRIDNRIQGMLHAVRDHKADMLVLGAYGTRKADVGFGSVATACVRHAPVPVLLVRDTQGGPFKTVVACVDFSATSKLVLEHAARLAVQDGSALHILHVFEAPWKQLHYRAPTPEANPSFQQQYREGLERRLRAFGEELGKEMEYLKPTVAVFDASGHRSGIVEYAAGVKADLVVLGTRGRTNLRDALLGTTAERALRESTCSVLAIKPGS